MRTEDRISALRLSLGTTIVFSLGLILGWPLAVIGAVFTALFLQSPTALPAAAFVRLFFFALALMFLSWAVFSVLKPYPVVFLGGVSIGIVLSFAWSVSGAGLLPGVLALMAAMMIPSLIIQAQSLTSMFVGWVPLNLLIAGLSSRVMFALLPAVETTTAEPVEQATQDIDQARRILRMSLVTVPFALMFFVVGSSAILVLFFVALLSQQLAAMTSAGLTVAKSLLTANLLGAAVSILCYEINVMAPHIITPILLCLTFCTALSALGKSNHFLATAAGSAMTTVLIIYGGSVSPFSDDADVKSIIRVVQIASAAVFVITAYIVVDEFWPEKEKQPAS